MGRHDELFASIAAETGKPLVTDGNSGVSTNTASAGPPSILKATTNSINTDVGSGIVSRNSDSMTKESFVNIPVREEVNEVITKRSTEAENVGAPLKKQAAIPESEKPMGFWSRDDSAGSNADTLENKYARFKDSNRQSRSAMRKLNEGPNNAKQRSRSRDKRPSGTQNVVNPANAPSRAVIPSQTPVTRSVPSKPESTSATSISTTTDANRNGQSTLRSNSGNVLSSLPVSNQDNSMVVDSDRSSQLAGGRESIPIGKFWNSTWGKVLPLPENKYHHPIRDVLLEIPYGYKLDNTAHTGISPDMSNEELWKRKFEGLIADLKCPPIIEDLDSDLKRIWRWNYDPAKESNVKKNEIPDWDQQWKEAKAKNDAKKDIPVIPTTPAVITPSDGHHVAHQVRSSTANPAPEQPSGTHRSKQMENGESASNTQNNSEKPKESVLSNDEAIGKGGKSLYSAFDKPPEQVGLNGTVQGASSFAINSDDDEDALPVNRRQKSWDRKNPYRLRSPWRSRQASRKKSAIPWKHPGWEDRDQTNKNPRGKSEPRSARFGGYGKKGKSSKGEFQNKGEGKSFSKNGPEQQRGRSLGRKGKGKMKVDDLQGKGANPLGSSNEVGNDAKNANDAEQESGGNAEDKQPEQKEWLPRWLFKFKKMNSEQKCGEVEKSIQGQANAFRAQVAHTPIIDAQSVLLGETFAATMVQHYSQFYFRSANLRLDDGIEVCYLRFIKATLQSLTKEVRLPEWVDEMESLLSNDGVMDDLFEFAREYAEDFGPDLELRLSSNPGYYFAERAQDRLRDDAEVEDLIMMSEEARAQRIEDGEELPGDVEIDTDKSKDKKAEMNNLQIYDRIFFRNLEIPEEALRFPDLSDVWLWDERYYVLQKVIVKMEDSGKVILVDVDRRHKTDYETMLTNVRCSLEEFANMPVVAAVWRRIGMGEAEWLANKKNPGPGGGGNDHDNNNDKGMDDPDNDDKDLNDQFKQMSNEERMETLDFIRKMKQRNEMAGRKENNSGMNANGAQSVGLTQEQTLNKFSSTTVPYVNWELSGVYSQLIIMSVSAVLLILLLSWLTYSFRPFPSTVSLNDMGMFLGILGVMIVSPSNGSRVFSGKWRRFSLVALLSSMDLGLAKFSTFIEDDGSVCVAREGSFRKKLGVNCCGEVRSCIAEIGSTRIWTGNRPFQRKDKIENDIKTVRKTFEKANIETPDRKHKKEDWASLFVKHRWEDIEGLTGLNTELYKNRTHAHLRKEILGRVDRLKAIAFITSNVRGLNISNRTSFRQLLQIAKQADIFVGTEASAPKGFANGVYRRNDFIILVAGEGHKSVTVMFIPIRLAGEITGIFFAEDRKPSLLTVLGGYGFLGFYGMHQGHTAENRKKNLEAMLSLYKKIDYVPRMILGDTNMEVCGHPRYDILACNNGDLNGDYQRDVVGRSWDPLWDNVPAKLNLHSFFAIQDYNNTKISLVNHGKLRQIPKNESAAINNIDTCFTYCLNSSAKPSKIDLLLGTKKDLSLIGEARTHEKPFYKWDHRAFSGTVFSPATFTFRRTHRLPPGALFSIKDMSNESAERLMHDLISIPGCAKFRDAQVIMKDECGAEIYRSKNADEVSEIPVFTVRDELDLGPNYLEPASEEVIGVNKDEPAPSGEDIQEWLNMSKKVMLKAARDHGVKKKLTEELGRASGREAWDLLKLNAGIDIFKIVEEAIKTSGMDCERHLQNIPNRGSIADPPFTKNLTENLEKISQAQCDDLGKPITAKEVRKERKLKRKLLILHRLPPLLDHLLADLYDGWRERRSVELCDVVRRIVFTMLHKGRGPRDAPDAYRFIAVASDVIKLYHAIISRRLRAVSAGYLPACQSAFRPPEKDPRDPLSEKRIGFSSDLHHTCMLAINRHGKLYSEARKQEGGFMIKINRDEQKAFPSWQTKVCITGMKELGFPENFIRIMEDLQDGEVASLPSGIFYLRLNQALYGPFGIPGGLLEGAESSPDHYVLSRALTSRDILTICRELEIRVPLIITKKDGMETTKEEIRRIMCALDANWEKFRFAVDFKSFEKILLENDDLRWIATSFAVHESYELLFADDQELYANELTWESLWRVVNSKMLSLGGRENMSKSEVWSLPAAKGKGVGIYTWSECQSELSCQRHEKAWHSFVQLIAPFMDCPCYADIGHMFNCTVRSSSLYGNFAMGIFDGVYHRLEDRENASWGTLFAGKRFASLGYTSKCLKLQIPTVRAMNVFRSLTHIFHVLRLPSDRLANALICGVMVQSLGEDRSRLSSKTNDRKCVSKGKEKMKFRLRDELEDILEQSAEEIKESLRNSAKAKAPLSDFEIQVQIKMRQWAESDESKARLSDENFKGVVKNYLVGNGNEEIHDIHPVEAAVRWISLIGFGRITEKGCRILAKDKIHSKWIAARAAVETMCLQFPPETRLDRRQEVVQLFEKISSCENLDADPTPEKEWFDTDGGPANRTQTFCVNGHKYISTCSADRIPRMKPKQDKHLEEAICLVARESGILGGYPKACCRFCGEFVNVNNNKEVLSHLESHSNAICEVKTSGLDMAAAKDKNRTKLAEDMCLNPEIMGIWANGGSNVKKKMEMKHDGNSPNGFVFTDDHEGENTANWSMESKYPWLCDENQEIPTTGSGIMNEAQWLLVEFFEEDSWSVIIDYALTNEWYEWDDECLTDIEEDLAVVFRTIVVWPSGKWEIKLMKAMYPGQRRAGMLKSAFRKKIAVSPGLNQQWLSVEDVQFLRDNPGITVLPFLKRFFKAHVGLQDAKAVWARSDSGCQKKFIWDDGKQRRRSVAEGPAFLNKNTIFGRALEVGMNAAEASVPTRKSYLTAFRNLSVVRDDGEIVKAKISKRVVVTEENVDDMIIQQKKCRAWMLKELQDAGGDDASVLKFADLKVLFGPLIDVIKKKDKEV